MTTSRKVRTSFPSSKVKSLNSRRGPKVDETTPMVGGKVRLLYLVIWHANKHSLSTFRFKLSREKRDISKQLCMFQLSHVPRNPN